jgi:peptidoglycan/xylan/chitin deacetylase (PgdA/CDA1 family)
MGAVRARARRGAQEALKRAAAGVDRVRPPARGVVVLIYHRVGRRQQLELDLAVDAFDAQMAALAASGRAATLGAALGVLDGTTAVPALDPVVVTFDDGTADFVDAALPVLVRHGIPSTLYLATAHMESGLAFPGNGKPLSWSALGEVCSTGLVAIGSHTHTHALLDRLPAHDAATELDRSIGLIGDRLGVRAEHFAYPKAVAPSPENDVLVRDRFRSAALAGTRANPYGSTDVYRLARSPVQHADGMRWFEHKLAGGLSLEDGVRRLANRTRYAGANA